MAPAGLLVAAVPAGVLPQAHAQSPSGLVALEVDELLPRAPQPGDPFQLTGRLVSGAGEPLTGLRVQIEVGRRLINRAQLAAAADGAGSSGGSSGTSSDTSSGTVVVTRDLPDLPGGGALDLDLRAEVDDLRLGRIGVYPLRVRVTARLAPGTARVPVGQVDTFLPWFAGEPVDPLRVAWVWPLVDQPRLGPDEVVLDDALTTSLAPGGRLAQSLATARLGAAGDCGPAAQPEPEGDGTAAATPDPEPACAAVPVTYAVDPALLEVVDILSRPHQIDEGALVVPADGLPAAVDWASGLQAALADGDLLALPYADPDVVALTATGTGLSGAVATARTLGETAVATLLPDETALGDVVLPPPGPVTGAALDALVDSDTEAVVLSASALTGADPDLRATPGARTALPSATGSLTGLVLDPVLSDLLTPDGGGPTGRLAEQRWLAESAMVSAELPAVGRTLLVAPARRGSPTADIAGQALLDTGRVPWLCPVRLADVVDGRERCAGDTEPTDTEPSDRGALTGLEPTDPVLGERQLERLAEVGDAVDQLTGAVLAPGTEAVATTRAGMLRTLARAGSSAWREDPRGAERLLGLLAQQVQGLAVQVQLRTGPVLLTSRQGRVDVTIVNDLDQPITVQVLLEAPNDARLRADTGEVYTIPANNFLPVEVEATTATSGRFVVKAQLLDREGRPFSSPQDLVVTSNRYGTVALAVTGLGAAVLLVASGVRITRRALSRR